MQSQQGKRTVSSGHAKKRRPAAKPRPTVSHPATEKAKHQHRMKKRPVPAADAQTASLTRGSESPLKRRNKLFSAGGSFDIPFFIIVMALLIIGVLMMFSASYAYAYYSSKFGNDGLFFVKQQVLFAVIGVAAMLFISAINYRVLHFWSLIIFGVSVVLLIAVLFFPDRNGAHRWIPYPINFQPSEIAKFAVIAIFAHFMSLNQKRMNTLRHGVLPYVSILVVVSALLIVEPHLSATILVCAIGGIMMIVGGTPLKYFGIAAGAAVACFVVVFFFPNLLPGGVGEMVQEKLAHAYQRIEVWQDPFLDLRGDGWQTVQSLYAIASGGFMGVGLGNSRQKYMYISEPQNDFVFAVVCEELGFVGAAVIIILFALLVWRGFVIAMRAEDKFGALLAVGLTVQVGLQAFLNIAVVTNTIPNTGISLPFFSYGGSSLIMLLAQMGVILSVSRGSKLRKSV